MLPSNLLLVVTCLTVDHRNIFFYHQSCAIDQCWFKQNNNKAYLELLESRELLRDFSNESTDIEIFTSG